MSLLVVRGATLIDGTGRAPVPNALVVAREDRIAYAGPDHGEGNWPTDATLMDATGHFVLPGLINCHDHLFNKRVRIPPRPDAASRYPRHASADTALALKCAYNARDELLQGVTTTRDLGTPRHLGIVLRDAVDAGVAEGPRIIAAGEAVTMTGGHFHPHSRQADGPDEVRKAVREQLRAGADCIKLMASGGIAGWPHERPGEVEYTLDELRAGVEEAHKRERRVAAHAMVPEAVRNALEAGVDTIEHGFLLDQETVRQMAQRGAGFVPTLNVSDRRFRLRPARSDHTANELARYLAEEVVPVHCDVFRAAAEAGVLIGAGTDSTGFLYEELALMVAYGFTPHEAIMAATKWAAIVCGCGDDRGTVEAGKLADLILLDADPLQDIAALRQVRLVVKDGAVVAGNEAAELAERAELTTHTRAAATPNGNGAVTQQRWAHV